MKFISRAEQISCPRGHVIFSIYCTGVLLDREFTREGHLLGRTGYWRGEFITKRGLFLMSVY